jgi:hypothetical protein
MAGAELGGDGDEFPRQRLDLILGQLGL